VRAALNADIPVCQPVNGHRGVVKAFEINASSDCPANRDIQRIIRRPALFFEPGIGNPQVESGLEQVRREQPERVAVSGVPFPVCSVPSITAENLEVAPGANRQSAAQRLVQEPFKDCLVDRPAAEQIVDNRPRIDGPASMIEALEFEVNFPDPCPPGPVRSYSAA
jgi:hypothetical protein